MKYSPTSSKSWKGPPEAGSVFGGDFAKRLRILKDSLLPYLKTKIQLLEESPTGSELSPEPDSPKTYSPGDDVRYIDWNLYARLDRLYMKTMTREEEVPLMFFLDASQSMQTPEPGKFVVALRVIAALADLYLSLGHRVLIVPWAEGIKGIHGPFTSEGDLEMVMQVLTTIGPGGGSDFKKSLGEAVPAGEPFRASPVIVSDFLFPLDFLRELDFLVTGGFPVSALQILSEREVSARLKGNLVLVDPETGKEATLHAGYRISRRYAEIFQLHLEQVRGLFQSRGAVFSRVLSSSPFETAVRNLLA